MPSIDQSLARPTRIHPLPSAPDGSLWIKREDELSSGVAGAKLRKYASLLPALRERGVAEVALIGGPNSNHLVGLLQLLREWRIKPWLFVREAADAARRGNALFIEMLAEPGTVTVVPRRDWPRVEQIAAAALAERSAAGVSTFLVPEGGFCAESLPGAMTLAEDILRNERESGLRFEHLFIDSGSGMSAIGLILGLAARCEDAARRRIHISLIAGDEADFCRRLKSMTADSDAILPQIDFLYPPIARSYGATNAALFDACRRIAREEGLLMDPVYSVKHYLSMQRWRETHPGASRSLFIYNGGSLGLAGFQRALAGE